MNKHIESSATFKIIKYTVIAILIFTGIDLSFELMNLQSTFCFVAGIFVFIISIGVPIEVFIYIHKNKKQKKNDTQNN